MQQSLARLLEITAEPRHEARRRPALLDAQEAAHYLGIGRSALYVLIKGGELAAVHIGRSTRIRVEELDRYIAAAELRREAS